MTKNIIFSIYIVFLFFINFLSAQTEQIENQIIEQINIKVHTSSEDVSDSSTILTRLKTKESGLFSQTEFDEDLKTLAQEYDRINPSVEMLNGRIYISLDVWPKPIIRTIRWHGNSEVSTSRLQRELNLYAFSTFDRQAFNEAFHKLKAYYIRKGFFEAELDYQIVLLPDENEVEIIIDIEEGRSGKIQKIVFENFTEKEESEILKEMITKKYNLFTSWYTQEGTYNEDAMQQDRFVITNYLQNQGYADAQVKIDVAEACKINRIVVTITADKGERYYFGQLSFSGNKLICSEDIDNLFTIHNGDPFSLEDLRETIDALTDAYGRLGYIDAVIDFEPQLVENEYRYNVQFTIEEGEQFRVGMIRVFGNTITQTPVILHETLLVPGEIFNNVKLKKTEQRLQNIGYFKHVNVYAVKGGESSKLEGNYRDVYIEVEETNTGQFSAFLGYSSVEEIFGGINITERNFNYKGFSKVWQEGLSALRGGGEFVNITAQVGQKSRNYVFSWTKPYFLDTQWTVGFDIAKTSTRFISKDYDLDTLGLNLRANYNINQFLRAGIHYRLTNGMVHLHHIEELEESKLENSPSLTSEILHARELLRKEARIHGLISAVGASLNYDSTDHPIKPRQGFRSKLSAEFAGIGGDHSFLSFSYLNSYYLGIGSRNVMRYRADFRFLQPIAGTRYETMPLDERIFLGGEFTVRGYRPYRLGPQYEETHVPRGGLSMQLYSIEFIRRVIRNVELFAFFDAGQLSQNTWEFGRLSAAVGYGSRFKIIESIPEITIGMGYPLNAKNRSEVKRFFFSVGGNF